MALKILTISHMHPTVRAPRHGIFLQRQARFLRNADIECSFLVPRPWAPWPLTLMSRWKSYGAKNPLLKTDFAVAEVPLIRPPGKWFSRFDSFAMAHSIVGKAKELHETNGFDAFAS